MRHLIITSVLCTTHLYSSTLTREEVHDLYASTNIIPVNKSRIMRWAGHVARVGWGEKYIGFWWGKPGGKSPLGRPSVDGRILLKWILKKSGVLGVDCVDLAQDKDKWPVLLNTVMSHRVPQSEGCSWLAEGLLASQEGLWSEELMEFPPHQWRWKGTDSDTCLQRSTGDREFSVARRFRLIQAIGI